MSADLSNLCKRTFDWFFRSRENGKVTIVEVPNAPLWLFFGLFTLRFALRPDGTAGTVLDAAVSISLAMWATIEFVTGVNPFRKLLGGLVLIYVVASFLT